MISIFSCPKSFRGHIGIIQRNAIKSWTLLRPKPEIMLFGGKEEEGVAEICKELDLRYITEVARNKFNTPMVNDVFEKAQRLATYDLVCYVNADIIVTERLLEATNIALQRWRRFVVICSPWNLCIDRELDFTDPSWKEKLFDMLQKKGDLPPNTGADLFLFPRGFYREIPPFALGRRCWDFWLVSRVGTQPPFIDASRFMCIVHQSHEGSTYTAPSHALDETEETLANNALMDKRARLARTKHCPYEITPAGRLRKKPLSLRLFYWMETKAWYYVLLSVKNKILSLLRFN